MKTESWTLGATARRGAGAQAQILLTMLFLFSAAFSSATAMRILADGCPPNGFFDPAQGKCVCKDTDRWNGEACCPPNGLFDPSSGQCYCKSSDSWTGRACCPPNGDYDFGADKCVCNSGFTWDGSACQQDPPLPPPVLVASVCGDGNCDPNESTGDCPWDCGLSPPDGSVPFLSAGAGLMYQNPMPNNGATDVYSGGQMDGKYIPYTDGCTVQPAEYKGHIQPSCYQHDFCWTCGGWYGLSFEDCNFLFKDSCHSLCDNLIEGGFFNGGDIRKNACGFNCDVLFTGVEAALVSKGVGTPSCPQLAGLSQSVRDSMRFLTSTPHIYGECGRWNEGSPPTC